MIAEKVQVRAAINKKGGMNPPLMNVVVISS